MFFMSCEWWLNTFERVLKCGRTASRVCRNVSKSGEGLSRCFTNCAETSDFYSEEMELRLEMQSTYRPFARDAHNA